MMNEAKLLEIDTSSDVGLEFSYKWSIRTPELLENFVSCKPCGTLRSPLLTNSFKFNGETMSLDWYIVAHPNGYTMKNSPNRFVISTVIANLPRSKMMKVYSLTISHIISIAELNILGKDQDEFGTETFLEYNTISAFDNIDKNILSKYDVINSGGFDIDAKICIQSIKFKHKYQASIIDKTITADGISKNININDDEYRDLDQKNNAISKKSGGNNINQEILDTLKIVQGELKRISRLLNSSDNDNNDKDDNNQDNQDNDS